MSSKTRSTSPCASDIDPDRDGSNLRTLCSDKSVGGSQCGRRHPRTSDSLPNPTHAGLPDNGGTAAVVPSASEKCKDSNKALSSADIGGPPAASPCI